MQARLNPFMSNATLLEITCHGSTILRKCYFLSLAPLKILYIDDNYLMFYACYSGASEFPCVQEAMEVTLVGRTRQISEDNKTDIYSILPKICVSPADMIDTVFAGKISRIYCHLKKKVPPH